MATETSKGIYSFLLVSSRTKLSADSYLSLGVMAEKVILTFWQSVNVKLTMATQNQQAQTTAQCIKHQNDNLRVLELQCQMRQVYLQGKSPTIVLYTEEVFLASEDYSSSGKKTAGTPHVGSLNVDVMVLKQVSQAFS